MAIAKITLLIYITILGLAFIQMWQWLVQVF